MKATKKKIALIASMTLACVLALSLGVSGLYAGAAINTDDDAISGRYYSDYASQEAVVAAGEEFNVQLASEGMVLLKNDGTLPVSSKSTVSVLGIAQDILLETSGTVTGSLRDAGFTVNPTLEEFYLTDNAKYTDFGNETALTNGQKQSMRLYDDIGVVVIARGTEGESGDRSLAVEEYEDETYLGSDQGWEHEAHESDGAGGEYKHELELTDSEQELIWLAEKYCKKVIVLYSAAYTFELGNLEDDPDVNAIVWMGRLGDGGITALGQMLTGEINPSGKLVDEWTRDFTNDPTYANAFPTDYETPAGVELEYAGYDYEEDIYFGYKYYETYWYEATQNNATPTISGTAVSADEWYDYNVVYPFGYGLSYTTFSFELDKLYTDTGSSIAGGTLKSSDISSSVGNPANITTLYADVTVKNTGSVAGKEVVQVYINAPYTQGGVEKAYYMLAGYAKTEELEPGASQTVTVAFDLQNFASYDADDANADGHTGYELDAGAYTVAVMESSSHTNVGADAYASATFEIDSTAYLDLDDFTGNEIVNLFSEKDENGDDNDFYSMKIGAETGMVLMSRSDFDGTAPTAPDPDEYVLTTDLMAALDKYDYIDADEINDADYAWYKTEDDIPSNWAQETGVIDPETGMYAITLNDMAGVELYNSDGTISKAWDDFMNQLTWDEVATLLSNGYHLTMALPSIGKVETSDVNGPNYTNNLTTWVGTPNVSATWNTELCERYGIMIGNTCLWQGMSGWYGPGANAHRNQFGGRASEYPSQDCIQGGYIVAAIIQGAAETGINAYIKHFAMYDICSFYQGGCVQVSEQAMRENYLRIFQIGMQEGGAHSTMTAFNRIGTVKASQNYALIQQLARDEWGWTGFCVTDMYGAGSNDNMSSDGLVRAGAEIPDGDFAGDEMRWLSGYWDATYVRPDGAVGAIMVNGEYSPTQWYCSRMAAMRLLYTEANSAGNNNGVTESTMNITVTGEQGQSLTQFLLPARYEGAGYSIDSYTLTGGSLPEGLTISDGYIGGVVTGAGEYTATMTLYIDGWIGVTVNYTFDIKPIVSIDSGGEDVSTINVGDYVDFDIVFDSSDVQYKSSYTVSIYDGALPAGLSVSEGGRVTGTATTAGTYTFTVAVRAVDDTTTVVEISDWALELCMAGYGMTEEEVKNAFLPGGSLSAFASMFGVQYVSANETFYLTYTMTVVGEGGDTGSGTTGDWEENVPYIGSNGNWFVNGEDLGVAAQGPAGADGKDGVDGVDGKDGADGSGCDSVAATDFIWMAVIVIAVLAAVLIVRKARKDRAGK